MGGKYFSILGDSISTLSGYSEPWDAVFYDAVNKREAMIYAPEDTWWGQVIAHLGGKLLVNNSISGSTVVRYSSYEAPFYACSDERTSSLATGYRTPDVIMVYIGTNDWGCGARVVPRNSDEEKDLSVFSVAYCAMLEKLKSNYPEAELWCFTPSVSKCSRRDDFEFPYCYRDKHIEEYCSAIRACAEKYGCRLIDLYRPDVPYDTFDGFHPNVYGMRTLSEAVISQL